MRAPRWPLLVGPLATLLALGGLWRQARRIERDLLVETDAALAAEAAAYLAAVTPTVDGRTYQVSGLLSAAHVVAGAAFWPGGIQVALNGTPLLPDTVGLGPLPGDLADRLELGAGVVVAAHRAGVAAVVPLLDRDQWETVGWVAAWGGVEARGPSRTAWGVAVLALLGALSAATGWPRIRGPWSGRAASMVTVASLASLALALGLGLRALAAQATDVRLLTLRRFAEIATTASRVRDADLPGFGAGATAVPVPAPDSAISGVRREAAAGLTVASVTVATPRSGGALEYRLPAREGQLGLAFAGLAGWVVLGAMGLGFSHWALGALRDAMRFQHLVAAWGFLSPALAHLAVFSFFPALFTFFLAFHRWDLLAAGHPFVGLENFAAAFGDQRFLHSLGVSALYALHVPVTAALALGAAVLLDRSGVGIRLLRTILFVPFISSVVAVALVWQWIYQPEAGLLNAALAPLGVAPRDWLGDPRTALLAIMVMSVWVQVGYQMVVFLGGLQAIPSTYLDSARVDGAGPWRRFWWITLPLLRPTVLFVLVTGIIGSFQVFTYIAVMTEGGPLDATDVAVFRIYQEAWEFLRFGTASAMSVVLLVVLLALTWLQFRWLGQRVEAA